MLDFRLVDFSLRDGPRHQSLGGTLASVGPLRATAIAPRLFVSGRVRGTCDSLISRVGELFGVA